MEDKKIPISFTQDQYKNLLLLINIGNWVIHSHEDDPDESKFSKLEGFVASHHMKFGADELVEFDEEAQEYFPTRKLEDSAHKLIAPYDDEVFWEALIEKCAARDLHCQFDLAQVKTMDKSEFFDKLQRLRILYAKEFSEHGIERIYVKNAGSTSPKVGRNDPCPCGSGKKYKKCCSGRSADTSETSPALPHHRINERVNANLHRLLAGKEFANREEMDAFLQKTLQESGGDIPDLPPQSALEEAQDLIYDAWETQSPAERVRLARRALEISPDCADAYNILAEDTNPSLDEATDLYQKALEAGERALGKEMFEEDIGKFWGLLETRPYMRAREMLAGCIWLQGKHKEAVQHYQELLRLNPNDNQGIRYVLSSRLLELSQFGELEKLFQSYPDDGAAEWAYAQALYCFLKEGAESVHSKQSLREALKANKHVPQYLLQQKKLPQKLPDYVGMGDEREAQACAHALLVSWKKNKGALEWLESSL